MEDQGAAGVQSEGTPLHLLWNVSNIVHTVLGRPPHARLRFLHHVVPFGVAYHDSNRKAMTNPKGTTLLGAFQVKVAELG